MHTSIEKKHARKSHALGEVLVCDLTNHGLLILVFTPFLETEPKGFLFPTLKYMVKHTVGGPMWN